MANSDIQLIVGANRSLSYSQLKDDIQSLISRFSDSKSNRIKIGVELSNKNQLRSQLSKEVKSLSGRVTGKIKIGIDRAYIEQQYRSVLKSISKGDFAKLSGLSLIDSKTLEKTKADAAELKRLKAEIVQGMSAGDIAKSFGIDTTKLSSDTTTVENLTKRIDKANKQLISSSKSLKQVGTGSGLDELIAKQRELGAELEKIRTLEGAEQAERLSQLESEIAAHNNKISTLRIEQNIQEALSRASKESSRSAKEAATANIKASNDATAAYTKQLNLVQQIQAYLKANSRIKGTRYETQLNGMLSTLNSGQRFDKGTINGYANDFKELKMHINEAGLAGKSFIDVMSSGIKKFSSWFGVSQLVMRGVQGIKKMISTVTELDTAMTELRKVTDLTEAQYEKFGVTASNIAKQVGATITDTINASADFARLGYDIGDASKLAEAALVYKNVGDGIEDVGEASESIISTIKAFGIEAEDAMGIVDRFNEVGNNFAISSEGIGTALKKSAAALSASGNTIEESIGLATGMNTVVQNPEQVGTALKTMTMYLRAAKVEAQEAGEDTEDMAHSVSELQKSILELTGNKVNIMLDEKNFKSTYQIIKEISEVWSDMAEVDQAALLKLIAGKRNANTVTSLINNFKDAEEAMKAASEATGSAEAENEKYLKSIEGRKARLKASFETISSDIFDSDAIKGTVSALTKIVDLADKFVSTLGTIPALVGTISAALSLKNVGRTKMFVLSEYADSNNNSVWIQAV